MQLPLARIEDAAIRETFKQVQDEWNGQDINLGGFKLFTLVTTGPVTAQEFYHTLKFTPKDVIVTRINGGTVTWSYDSFTKDKIVFTTSAAVTIRFLLGSID